MPQLRKDPIIGRWVIISTERGKRPNDFGKTYSGPPDKDCPFCEGKEAQTPPEIYAVRPQGTLPDSKGWKVRVVPSIAPFLDNQGELWKKGIGLYDLIAAYGSHEVVVETPNHIANMADLEEGQIEDVLTTYVKRIEALKKDKKIKYVLVFKNYGWQAGGGRVQHSRSQIIATPVNLKRVKEELEGSKKYYAYHERCVYCDIVREELDLKERIVLDIDGILAVVPFASRFPFEVWILPKKHSADFHRIDSQEKNSLAKVMKEVLDRIKRLLNDPPYNYVIHTAPFRRAHKGYWTTIDEDYHWHIEVIPRLTEVAGFEWGTGFYICPTPPEEAAKYLREV